MPTNTAEIVEYYSKYINYWEVEMDNTLNILKGNLQSESLRNLEDAQNSWSEYMKNDISTASQIYIDIMGIGSEIPILAANKDMLLIRNRVLELAEYCIITCGHYDFVSIN